MAYNGQLYPSLHEKKTLLKKLNKEKKCSRTWKDMQLILTFFLKGDAEVRNLSEASVNQGRERPFPFCIINSFSQLAETFILRLGFGYSLLTSYIYMYIYI